MSIAKLDHSAPEDHRTAGRHIANEEPAEEEDRPVTLVGMIDKRKHRCRICHLHVIPGLAPDSILGGQLTADGVWQHLRCR